MMRMRGVWGLGASVACVVAAFVVVAMLSPAKTAGPCAVLGNALMLRDVPEASGLAVSRRHDGVLWTHNDSGHATELFAVDVTSGTTRGPVRVPARTRDWEDVSAGRCGNDACLYIADIGDNSLARGSIQVLRVPEPEMDDTTTAAPNVFTLRYPDGPHNAEAMFVIGATVVVITRDGTGTMYRSRSPLADAKAVMLQRIGQLGLIGVTDAEASPDELSVVVRTSDEAIVYRTADLLNEGSAPPGLRIPIDRLREPQGEGVAIDGDRLYLASEGQPWSRAGRLLSLQCSLPSRPVLSAEP